MLEIKLYSTGTTTSTYIKEEVQRQLDLAGIIYRWSEIQDIETFLREKVKSVPALKFQEETYYFKQSGILKTHLESIIQNIIDTAQRKSYTSS